MFDIIKDADDVRHPEGTTVQCHADRVGPCLAICCPITSATMPVCPPEHYRPKHRAPNTWTDSQDWA